MSGRDSEAGADRAPYHHGDLRAALLRAGEAELAEAGVERFSLRAVARRVGVSHSAPAHHFGDARGLVTALAAEGFRRFLAAMQARQAEAEGEDAVALLTASGLGYVDFAQASPTLFRLMFASERVKGESEELREAAEAAYAHLVADVARLRGAPPEGDPEGMAEVAAAWSLSHGFAELLVSGRLAPPEGLDGAAREAFFRRVFSRLRT
jgi:AcrR family transcriptional regulator